MLIVFYKGVSQQLICRGECPSADLPENHCFRECSLCPAPGPLFTFLRASSGLCSSVKLVSRGFCLKGPLALFSGEIWVYRSTSCRVCHKRGCVFHCCITNQHTFSGLKQQPFIISQFLEVSRLSTTRLSSLLKVSQGWYTSQGVGRDVGASGVRGALPSLFWLLAGFSFL